MAKWKNKYRIESARAPWWDYGSDGGYFITICTENRTHFFGECKDGKMTLSAIGAIIQGFWHEIPHHFPFVHLGAFTVMPNHVHGILIIDKAGYMDGRDDGTASSDTGADGENATGDENVRRGGENATGDENVRRGGENATGDEKVRRGGAVVSTGDAPDFRTPAEKRINTQGKHTASSIVGSFKSICTKHINLIYPEKKFEWQERFWDNIIKDDRAYDEITNYIHLNRKKWREDRFFDE